MANYINFTKATFNPYNPKVLNEGQFSWMAQDTGDQIGSEKQNTIDVYMYDNQGNQWYENRYEGYGEFGGMDYYELLAVMNGYSEEDVKTMKGSFKELRNLGIDLAFGKIKTKDKGRKVLFPALVTDPKFNWKRHDFTQEPESDPNQSWYQEPEYDDDYEEYDESVVTEANQDALKRMKEIIDIRSKMISDYMKKHPTVWDTETTFSASDTKKFRELENEYKELEKEITNESVVNEEAVEVTPDSKVVVDDYLLDDAETEIKSTEIIGAIVSANSEDEFLGHFYKEYGNGAFTETDIAKLIAYYQEYREEVNAAETEAEEEAEAGDEKDPLANLDI